ncbi:MAG: hypothetical protein GW928_00065 [Rhodoferax sp.]|nr:hypothetical protein [Rhodoferax sp.]
MAKMKAQFGRNKWFHETLFLKSVIFRAWRTAISVKGFKNNPSATSACKRPCAGFRASAGCATFSQSA